MVTTLLVPPVVTTVILTVPHAVRVEGTAAIAPVSRKPANANVLAERMFSKRLLTRARCSFLVRAGPFCGPARTVPMRREVPRSRRTGKAGLSGLGVIDVLLGLLRGFLRLRLGIDVRVKRGNRRAEAHSLLARGCACGAGIGANRFKGHVAH